MTHPFHNRDPPRPAPGATLLAAMAAIDERME